MSVMKYKDPTTGEIKKVGSPKYDVYSKDEVYNKEEINALLATAGGANIVVSKLQPTSQKAGDFWYEIIV